MKTVIEWRVIKKPDTATPLAKDLKWTVFTTVESKDAKDAEQWVQELTRASRLFGKTAFEFRIKPEL